jgi:hypothetical protein
MSMKWSESEEDIGEKWDSICIYENIGENMIQFSTVKEKETLQNLP